MGRIKRVYFESAWYHITARGNNRHPVLGSNQAKARFIAIIQQYQARKGFLVLGFTVMDNHFHLLLQVREDGHLSKIMQGILLSYSWWYRQQCCYVGHVWQGRFISRVIQDERQLSATLRYIHENPVKAGIVRQTEDYRWSSAKLLTDGTTGSVEGMTVSLYNQGGDSSRGK